MARDVLTYASGNSASTTLSSAVTGSDTTLPLTSDTNFNAKSGEGMVIVDEGAATEELAYATGKSGGALTIPLANRGLEGGSAQGHASGASVKGIITAAMWNDLIDSVSKVISKVTGLADLQGNTFDLDADNDTSIRVATDDQIDIEVGGSDLYRITSTDLSIPTGGNIQVNNADPKRTMYVPANGMFPSTTAGCATLTQVESSTNDVNIKVLDFDGAGSSKEYAEFGIQSPTYWDASTVTAQFVWYASAGSDTVNWEIQGLAFTDDDALDVAYGTLQEVTDTVTAIGDVHISAETSAITLGGTGSPAAGDWVQFKVARDPANDTNTSDARLMGVRIRFGVKQFNDA